MSARVGQSVLNCMRVTVQRIEAAIPFVWMVHTLRAMGIGQAIK
jgi:hypothetical protein